MLRVSTLPFVYGKNIPQAVKLTMLAEQMLSAQMFRIDIPDSHWWTTPRRTSDRESVEKVIDILTRFIKKQRRENLSEEEIIEPIKEKKRNKGWANIELANRKGTVERAMREMEL